MGSTSIKVRESLQGAINGLMGVAKNDRL